MSVFLKKRLLTYAKKSMIVYYEKNIFSKVNNELLHMVYDTNIIEKNRIDLIGSENFLQCALVKNSDVGYKYRPHFHNSNKVNYEKMQTQETWFVLSGSVKVYHYDINGELLNVEILKGRSKHNT